MSSTTDTYTPNPRKLRILQANVRFTAEAQNTLLQLAETSGYDIVLVQEPNTSLSATYNYTPTIRSYDVHSPVYAWSCHDTRPRVLTFVRKGIPFRVYPTEDFRDRRDILVLKVGGIHIVNIYRKKTAGALAALTDWTPPAQTIVAGDFNAGAPMWQDCEVRDGGDLLEAWADTHNLSLISPFNIPTHDKGNTLDLVLSNIRTIDTTIEQHLHTGSDHDTLSTEVTLETPDTAPVSETRLKITAAHEKDKFLHLLQSGLHTVPLHGESGQDLDRTAQRLTKLIQTALACVGHEPRPAFCKGAWTQECKVKHDYYIATKRSLPERTDLVEEARRDFHATVKAEKRQYNKTFIESLKKPADIYKVTGWTKRTSSLAPAPIVWEDKAYATAEERAAILRERLLGRGDASADISDPWAPDIHPEHQIPALTPPSLEEVAASVLGVGNTSPGSDGITVDLLKIAWPIIGLHVRFLYTRCIALGYHPQPFKEAEAVFIPKAGKRDQTMPSAWRPISLLSCLGKGLERLIGRRISILALQYKILHPNQAGALKKRSAVDIAAALIHDMEDALHRKLYCLILTMDFEGAFDGVLPLRLILALREQGWHRSLIDWVASFLTGRQARVRLPGYTSPITPLHCGLPQGSPVSQILFLLWAAGLMKGDARGVRRSYADDYCSLHTGRTPSEAAASATADAARVLRWGRDNGTSFSPTKTAVQYFTRNTRSQVFPPVYHDDIAIEAQPLMKWLGLHLDKGLTFCGHVKEKIRSCNKLTGLLRRISNTQRGPTGAAMRNAITTCILPTVLYGAEAWYQGPPGPDHHGHLAVLAGLVRDLDTCIKAAIRVAIPAWKRTSSAAMHRESGIPPASILLQQIRLRAAARYARLDNSHPFVSRLYPNALPDRFIGASKELTRNTLGSSQGYRQSQGDCQPGETLVPTCSHGSRNTRNRAPKKPYLTRLQRAAALLPRPGDRPMLRLPAEKISLLNEISIPDVSKDAAKALLLQKTLTYPTTDTWIYSDGSQTAKGTGWGYVIIQDGRTIASQAGALPGAEVFDAEIEGASAALQAALTHTATQYHVCIDNQAVLHGIIGHGADSSADAFQRFGEMTQIAPVSVHWAPGHVGIPGNEAADALAKEGADMCAGLPPPETNTVAAIKRIARTKIHMLAQQWWQANIPEEYQRMDLCDFPRKAPAELHLPRTLLHRLIAARTGTGDFAAFHTNLDRPERIRPCGCGGTRNPTHIFYCRAIPKQHRPRLSYATTGTPPAWEALGKDFPIFVKTATASGFFTDICPHAFD